jgi:NDP-sugar pyrophosphorylase family protein
MRIAIPMAGLGSRFANAGYKDHKPLISVNGKTLLQYTVESLDIQGEYVLILRDLGNGYTDTVHAIMRSLNVDYRLVLIDRVTGGAAETALYGLSDEYNEELIVTNCDQYLEWDSQAFLKESRNYHASVLTYQSNNPKNSFAEIINNSIVRIVEKEPISRDALVGVHYWERAGDFISATEKLMRERDVHREAYISETLNYLLKEGKSVGAVPIHQGRYWSTGTPEDLSVFKGYVMEYKVPKPKTYLLDLDGTVLMHAHKYSNLSRVPELCPGVKEALDEIDSRGDKIILMSARKESARKITESILNELSVPFDQLVLNVGQGCRVIVNDKSTPRAESRCRAVDVIADAGWSTADLS